MAGREVILITGANTRIGFQIIRALCSADKAYYVIVGDCTLAKVQDAIRSATAEFPDSCSKLFPLQVDNEHDDSSDELSSKCNPILAQPSS